MITVRLPSTLKVSDADVLEVHEPVGTISELVDVLDRRIPGFRDQLDDSVFNFAVNDEMLLHHAKERTLRAGDVVEIVPTISGGEGSSAHRLIGSSIHRLIASGHRSNASGHRSNASGHRSNASGHRSNASRASIDDPMRCPDDPMRWTDEPMNR